MKRSRYGPETANEMTISCWNKTVKDDDQVTETTTTGAGPGASSAFQASLI